MCNLEEEKQIARVTTRVSIPDINQDGTDTPFIQAKDSKGSIDSRHPPFSRRRDIIRLFKLQFLSPFRSWRSPIEHKKVALHQNHLVAIGHILLHLVPLGGAITLLVLNWSQYFAGSHFNSSTTLQFVAKPHELLMQTSIAEVVLSIVRSQALEGYVPLGAFSAATETLHISYIWSGDSLAAATSECFTGSRKYLFVVVVPLLIALTALVGPSSAALMIPRPGSSNRPTMFRWGLNDTVDSYFPSHVGAGQGLAL